MSVMDDILKLALLTGCKPFEIQHHVTGRDNGGEVTIEVRPNRCIAVTRIEQTNVDAASPSSLNATSDGTQQGLEQDVEIAASGDLLLPFHSGKVVITFTLTPLGGQIAHTQVTWYELPEEPCLGILQKVGTRQNVQ